MIRDEDYAIDLIDQNLEDPESWKEAEESEILDLGEGEITLRQVWKHLPTNKFWEVTWTQEQYDSVFYDISWKEVVPKEVMKVVYVGVDE